MSTEEMVNLVDPMLSSDLIMAGLTGIAKCLDTRKDYDPTEKEKIFKRLNYQFDKTFREHESFLVSNEIGVREHHITTQTKESNKGFMDSCHAGSIQKPPQQQRGQNVQQHRVHFYTEQKDAPAVNRGDFDRTGSSTDPPNMQFFMHHCVNPSFEDVKPFDGFRPGVDPFDGFRPGVDSFEGFRPSVDPFEGFRPGVDSFEGFRCAPFSDQPTAQLMVGPCVSPYKGFHPVVNPLEGFCRAHSSAIQPHVFNGELRCAHNKTYGTCVRGCKAQRDFQ